MQKVAEDKMPNLTNAHREFLDRILELRSICDMGSVWVFVCTSAFIEYLAKLVDGADRKSTGYKEFIEKWMAQANPLYNAFKYHNGTTDLPVQMYHVLRCGIVHNLSLIPDSKARRKGGRDRSIALLHRAESKERNIAHLSNYKGGIIKDGAAFVAEDLIDDIEIVVNLIFDSAKSDKNLEENILRWLSQYPLIVGGH